jgi:hypothetical protein
MTGDQEDVTSDLLERSNWFHYKALPAPTSVGTCCALPRVVPTQIEDGGRLRERRPVAWGLVVAMLITLPAWQAAARSNAESRREAQATQELSDIDLLIQRVFDNRDASWRQLGDFVMRERLTLELDAPAEFPSSGLEREYEWYVHDGVAVRSPVRIDGVEIDDEQRHAYEDEWLREEERRHAASEDDVEPRYVTDSYYFLEWQFEPGNYYLVGRETIGDQEVLRVEYYPTASNDQGFNERINRGFAKTSMVTMWVDPVRLQLLRYSFDNPGLDFLRFQWLLRVDGLEASMEMAPVGDLWMLARATTSGRVTTALGGFAVTITREFFDYRDAETGVRLIEAGPLQ